MSRELRKNTWKALVWLTTFEDANAVDRHDVQYFEIMGNRGIYYKGWTAVTKHRTPWLLFGVKNVAFDDDNWELYDTTKDWTQANDLSKKEPEKLHELQRQWLIEATRYNVLPLDDRAVERLNAELAGRPEVISGKTQFLYPGMILNDSSVINLKNKSHSVTAEVEIPSVDSKGVIVAQGANFGGWALYVRAGKLKYVYNFLGLALYEVEAPSVLSAGKHEIKMEFKYDGGGLGKGGAVSLLVDGQKVSEGRLEHTVPMIFSVDSSCMVGDKLGAPISGDFKEGGNKFNGKVNWVRIDLGSENFDSLITPEEWVRIHMSTQ